MTKDTYYGLVTLCYGGCFALLLLVNWQLAFAWLLWRLGHDIMAHVKPKD